MTTFYQLRDVKFTEKEAMAMAQLCKRISLAACREHAVDHDEAYEMLAALCEIQKALAHEGFAPR